MKYDPNRHHRQSVRLKNYAYSQNGAYFITLCTHERKNLFGHIDSDEMHLNSLGKIVQDEWLKSFEIRKELAMDAYTIMPNHLHGIVFISHQDNQNNPPLKNKRGARHQSIGSFIIGFKSAVTRRIRDNDDIPQGCVWQRNYHEHIIRCEKSLKKIREYTINNPSLWQQDSLFVQHKISCTEAGLKGRLPVSPTRGQLDFDDQRGDDCPLKTS
ncbi:MAG: transposase [Gammaproteobacteria bacterium]|nr:transposase [Gammaproteobacteria bacterium]